MHHSASINEWPITKKRCIIADVNWVSIGSGNGLSPAWHQTIIWTNAELLWIGPRKKVKLESKFKPLIHENEDVVCEIAPMCPGGVKLIDMTWYLFNALRYQNSHFGGYFMSQSQYFLADWQTYGMF